MADDNPDLYDDGDGSGEQPKAESSKSEMPTTLIAKSFFGGHDCEPGDKYEVRIARVMDDQVEVELESSNQEKESDDDDTELAPPPPDDMMLE